MTIKLQATFLTIKTFRHNDYFNFLGCPSMTSHLLSLQPWSSLILCFKANLLSLQNCRPSEDIKEHQQIVTFLFFAK